MTKPDYKNLIDHCREEQAKLQRSIKAMEEKWMGVGLPVTIPHAVNEPTKRMIRELKAAIEEWEQAIREFEKASHA